MYDNELYNESRSAIESCSGIRQAFQFLPTGVEISVIIDDRYPCTLKVTDTNELKLLPVESTSADFQFTIYPETIRRLRSTPPADFIVLYRDIIALQLVGHLRLKVLSSPADLIKKGYLLALKNLPAEIQGECSKYLLQFAGAAAQSIDLIKRMIKK